MEWQKIESALKDGTAVDLWVCHSEKFQQFMRYPQCVWRGGKWYSNFAPRGQSSPLESRPTHWRPTPEPPQ